MTWSTRTFTVSLIPVDKEKETRLLQEYNVESSPPVEFFRRNAFTYMVYDRTMARKENGCQ